MATSHEQPDKRMEKEMEPKDACHLLNDELIWPAGWKVVARVATHIHGGEIHVTVKYPGVDTGPQKAAEDYPVENVNFAGFFLTVGDLTTKEQLIRRVITDIISQIRAHEDREMVRFRDTLQAPFHPHTVEGRKAWGDHASDATFGYPVFLPESATRVDGIPSGYERLTEDAG